MNPVWRKYLARTAPRYTSYPSALAFTADVGPREAAEALAGVEQYEPVSVYVHVPYCARLCWYCGCNMSVENRYARSAPYRRAIVAEIEAAGERLAGRGVITQVHFGGGTPNYLRAEHLGEIVDAVERSVGLTDAAPLAIEIDPRLVGEASVAELAAAGFSRMNIGVQDFDADVQAAINRVQDYPLVESVVAAMRCEGVDDLGLDLLYGLPRQTLSGFLDTADKTLALAPDRISLFGYAHIPDRLVHQRLIDADDLPDADGRLDLAEAAAERFVAAGYRRIGFDHFAMPGTAIAEADRAGRLNRNFQGFTEDPAETVLGFGPSAISCVGGLYVQNAKPVADYVRLIGSAGCAAVRGVRRTGRDRAVGDWLKDLLCGRPASLEGYFEALGASAAERAAVVAAAAPLAEDGVIEIRDGCVVVPHAARPLLRAVAAAFDPAVRSTKTFASPAV